MKNADVFPLGFSVHRNDRHVQEDGVFLLLGNNLRSMQLSVIENKMESVWSHVFAHGLNLIIGPQYRPQGTACGQFKASKEPIFSKRHGFVG